MKSVVVFCSASEQVAPIYFSEISLFGEALARAGVRVIYGGGRLGLMGRLADSVLAAGGEVIGVMPQYLVKESIIHKGLTQLIVVDGLLDRKRKMLDLADAAVAFAGGIGTLDEITEVLALKQLGEVSKPVYFHNYLQFWDPLFIFFEELIERRMIHQNLDDLYEICETTEEIISRFK